MAPVPGNASGQTEARGVWVAGNVADVTAGVRQSAASGVSAAVAINAAAIAEPTATPGVHYVRELLELARGRDQNPLAALRAAKSLAGLYGAKSPSAL